MTTAVSPRRVGGVDAEGSASSSARRWVTGVSIDATSALGTGRWAAGLSVACSLGKADRRMSPSGPGSRWRATTTFMSTTSGRQLWRRPALLRAPQPGRGAGPGMESWRAPTWTTPAPTIPHAVVMAAPGGATVVGVNHGAAGPGRTRRKVRYVDGDGQLRAVRAPGAVRLLAPRDRAPDRRTAPGAAACRA